MNISSGTSRIAVTDTRASASGWTRTIELHRPEKLNCLSLAMLDELLLALQGCGADRIILAGAGRSFCSGLDLKEVTGPAGARAHLERLVGVYRWFLKANIPTVVLARGVAAGGGAGLMACARTVIASSDFHIRLPGGSLASLAAVVTPILNLRAKDNAPAGGRWLGCDMGVTEAHRLGLVDTIVSPARLDELINEAKGGKCSIGLPQSPMREEGAVIRALLGLEAFLGDFKAE